jgi:hypothetical protein
MKSPLRAAIIGICIWILGVSVYSLSFYIPILENGELQANLALMASVIPLVWFGAKTYYEKATNPNGILLGLGFFLTAAVLDALITVPYLIIPHGGSYAQFFTDPGFWLIGLEFVIVSTLYGYSVNSNNRETTIN